MSKGARENGERRRVRVSQGMLNTDWILQVGYIQAMQNSKALPAFLI